MLALGACFPQPCSSAGHRFAVSRLRLNYYGQFVQFHKDQFDKMLFRWIHKFDGQTPTLLNRDMNKTPTHLRVPLKFQNPLQWKYYHWPVPNPHPRRSAQYSLQRHNREELIIRTIRPTNLAGIFLMCMRSLVLSPSCYSCTSLVQTEPHRIKGSSHEKRIVSSGSLQIRNIRKYKGI